MKNELLTIGPVTIHGYGLMIGIGVIAAYLTAEYRARKLKLDADQVFSLVIWCLIFGGLGSKLLFCQFSRIHHRIFVKNIDRGMRSVFFDRKNSCHIGQRHIGTVLKKIAKEIQPGRL